jgi:hypothetical protein
MWVNNFEVIATDNEPISENFPERRLWAAVFRQACTDFLDSRIGKRGVKREDAKSAMEWIFVPSNDKFSFENVCEMLGVDPGRVRRELMQNPREIRTKISHGNAA